MEPRPQRKTERLRHGRVSMPGARYFVTLVIAGRVPVFAEAGSASAQLYAALARLDADGDTRFLAVVLMPDHVHFLFTLGARLTVSQVIGKLKALVRAPAAFWRWQENFFEHRLRPEEDSEDYARYLFMNPYRAGLISVSRTWWGWSSDPDRGWRWRFEDVLNPNGTPPPEWLGQIEPVVAGE